jgi:hypothetical protein
MNEPMALRRGALWLMPALYVGNGIVFGGMCGAISGSLIVPALGTVFGLLIGAAVGGLAGIPIGVALAITTALTRNIVRQAFKAALTIIALAVVIGAGILIFTKQEMFLPALIPAAAAAGHAGEEVLMGVMEPLQRQRLQAEPNLQLVKFSYVIWASFIAPVVFWITIIWSITFMAN